jgi:hypothetical protein
MSSLLAQVAQFQQQTLAQPRINGAKLAQGPQPSLGRKVTQIVEG